MTAEDLSGVEEGPQTEAAIPAANAVVAESAAYAAILEGHFAEIQALYARAAGGEVRNTGGVQLGASGLPTRLLNAANLAHFTDASSADGIEDAKAFFKRFGVPFRWLFGATSTPRDLPERFEAAGFIEISNTSGMALDIATMRDEPTTIPGLDVREVADRSELRAWLEVCRISFPFDPVEAAAWRRAHEPLGWGDDSPLHNYIAWLHGRAVAVSSLLHGRHAAGIHNVGTVAEVRGRGIGRETTLAPLRDAGAAGYAVSVLGASPLGLPVYRRIGFVEICRNRHFGPPRPDGLA